MKYHAIKLCVTGGHATPALAVVDAVRRNRPDWEIVWIGRSFALEGSSIPAEEYQLVREQHIRFLSISAGRLSRPGKIVSGFFQAFRYCMEEKPDCIVSFGGYVALPVAVAGWSLKIPVITHEQTHGFGLANRIIARIARRICISYPESAVYFPREKTVLTGLPLRKKLFHPSKTSSIGVAVSKPVLYVTGGSTGAASLNELLFPVVSQLTEEWSVIHQTGRVSFDHATKVKQALLRENQSRYMIKPYVSEDELAWIYEHASVVIARSGANTVGELAALKKVSIVVPLPWSSYQEQQANAAWLAEAGSAVVVNQRTMTPQLLVEILHRTMRDGARYQKNADSFSLHIPRDADMRVAKEIEKLVASCTEKLL